MTTTFCIGEIDVPALAVGTMYFGTSVPQPDALSCLDTAFDVGARFWDTANNYAFWAGGVGDESENTIGRWLARHGPAARDDVILATKVGARPRRHGAGLDDALGLSPAAVRDQVTASLSRLGTDHVDVLYAHVDDRAVPFDETLEAFEDLVSDGLVRAIAASNLTADRLREALAEGSGRGYQALQQRFTYLRPAPDADLGPHVLLDDEVSSLCETHGLTRLGYSPLLSGAYTRPDRPMPHGYRLPPDTMSLLDEVGAESGLDAGQTVLAWMVGRREPVIPVVGVSRPDHVRAAWTAVHTSPTPEDIARLETARRG